jgi:hypothetical protein
VLQKVELDDGGDESMLQRREGEGLRGISEWRGCGLVATGSRKRASSPATHARGPQQNPRCGMRAPCDGEEDDRGCKGK